MKSAALAGNSQRLAANPLAEVWLHSETGEHSLHAAQSFSSNQIITSFSAASILSHPTYLTVQTDIHQHITLNPSFLQYVNHSCSPNVFFDTTRMELIALTHIEVGDELVFFYPSTEWSMQQPFSCRCGSRSCLQTIKGAAHLPLTRLKKYRLSDFVIRQLNLPARKQS